MPDLPISQLPQLSGAGLATNDALAVADTSGSETKQITAKDLVQAGVALIDPNSIPSDKVDFTLPAGSVGTTELADGAVTGPKLADGSSAQYNDASSLPAAGDFIGQLFVENTNNSALIWTGSSWEPLAGVLTADAPSIYPLYLDASVDLGASKVTVSGYLQPTTGANQFLAGPTGTAGAVDYRKIEGSDLPAATSVDLGGVKPGPGLTVDSGGILSVDNTVTPSTTNHVVTYDANGLITGGRAIVGTDLPTATSSTTGVIRPGTGLVMGSNSELNHQNGVTAGNATKVSFDAQGHITAALPLLASDIPNISFDQVTTGEVDGSKIVDRSINEIKLSDYSTCFVQEGQPSGDHKLGQLWFTPSTSQLRVYGRGSGSDYWISVGFGALQNQNLRWGGTFDAATSQIISVTDLARAEGLQAGDAIPAPTDALSGMYFVCQVAGSALTLDNVVGEVFTEGDWLLCINQAQGYIHLDVNAAGGGGGATYLDNLLDVEIASGTGIPLADQNLFAYDGTSGMWVNTDVIDCGTF